MVSQEHLLPTRVCSGQSMSKKGLGNDRESRTLEQIDSKGAQGDRLGRDFEL